MAEAVKAEIIRTHLLVCLAVPDEVLKERVKISMTYRLFDPMLEKVEGPLVCFLDGRETIYSSARELMEQDFEKKYEISGISAKNGQMVITIQESGVIPNDLTAGWAKEYMEKTGQEISFF